MMVEIVLNNSVTGVGNEHDSPDNEHDSPKGWEKCVRNHIQSYNSTMQM